jgi:hypothetical protein
MTSLDHVFMHHYELIPKFFASFHPRLYELHQIYLGTGKDTKTLHHVLKFGNFSNS